MSQSPIAKPTPERHQEKERHPNTLQQNEAEGQGAPVGRALLVILPMMENSVAGTAPPPPTPQLGKRIPPTPQLGKRTPLTAQPALIDMLLIVPVEENRIPVIHV